MDKPLSDPMLEAIEKLLNAYRKKYLTPSTNRIRANAPLQKEMGILAAEYQIARQIYAPRVAGHIPEKTNDPT